jgi:hypothetical protein
LNLIGEVLAGKLWGKPQWVLRGEAVHFKRQGKMQMLKRFFRTWSSVMCVVGVVMACSQTHASSITDSFSFNNLSSNGDTITGTFTYDTSAPTVVTDLTLDFDSNVYDSATSVDPAVLPTFDGTELNGAFSMDAYEFPIFEDFLSGSFGPGPDGSASVTYTYFGEIPFGGDSVSGPITYDLSGPTGGGGGSSAPLPCGALGGLMGMLAMGGISIVVRKRAVRM